MLSTSCGGYDFVSHIANRLHQKRIHRQALCEASTICDGNHFVFVGDNFVDGIAELVSNFLALLFGEGIDTSKHRMNFAFAVVLRCEHFHSFFGVFNLEAAVNHRGHENNVGNTANV